MMQKETAYYECYAMDGNFQEHIPHEGNFGREQQWIFKNQGHHHPAIHEGNTASYRGQYLFFLSTRIQPPDSGGAAVAEGGVRRLPPSGRVCSPP